MIIEFYLNDFHVKLLLDNLLMSHNSDTQIFRHWVDDGTIRDDAASLKEQRVTDKKDKGNKRDKRDKRDKRVGMMVLLLVMVMILFILFLFDQ